MTMPDLSTIALMVLAPWTAAAGTIWTTWWAAQSRDAAALRVIAAVLVIVPALLWPLLSLAVTTDLSASVAGRTALIGFFSGGVALTRGLFLIVWAAVSKDRSYLRMGGGVVGLLEIVGAAMPLLLFMASW